MQKSQFILSLILVSLCTYQPMQGQNFLSLSEELISDSWYNAGHWFEKPKDLKTKHLVYALAGTSAIAISANFDQDWQQSLALGTSDQNSVYSQISEPFGNPVKMGLLALGTYYASGYLQKEKLQGASSAALQSMLTAGLAAMTLKLLLHRERPEEQLNLDPYRFNGPSFSSENLSFPSGHSATAFALASSLSAYFQNDWRLSLPLYLLASATAYQRIRDFKHWPSDVVAGALLGIWIGQKIGTWQREKSSHISFGLSSDRNSSLSLSLRITLD